MKASELIRDMLKRILGWTEGDANAATIERKRGDSGYGWYVKRFGENGQGTFWGANVAEASAAMDDETTEYRERERFA